MKGFSGRGKKERDGGAGGQGGDLGSNKGFVA